MDGVSHPLVRVETVIAPDKSALRVGSAKLIVDGTDTTLVRKAEIALRPSRVRARLVSQLLQFSCDIYNGDVASRRDRLGPTSQGMEGRSEGFLQSASRAVPRNRRRRTAEPSSSTGPGRLLTQKSREGAI